MLPRTYCTMQIVCLQPRARRFPDWTLTNSKGALQCSLLMRLGWYVTVASASVHDCTLLTELL